jgi:hypothetical protein
VRIEIISARLTSDPVDDSLGANVIVIAPLV